MILAGMALLATSCIKDNGNYDYTLPLEPEVTLEEGYTVELGTVLHIAPEVVYSGPSKLRYVYEFFDRDNAEEALLALDGNEDGSVDLMPGMLAPGGYDGKLTVIVPDDSGINADPDDQGMKYFETFAVLIQTSQAFSAGRLVLVDDGGQAKLHFINPEDAIIEDVYNAINAEPLPGAPRQLLSAFILVMGGGDPTGGRQGYWILTDNEGVADGVKFDANTLNKTNTLQGNFFSPPKDMSVEMDAQMLKDYMMGGPSSGSMVMALGGKVYPGTRVGYYMQALNSWGKFGAAISGEYNVSGLAQDMQGPPIMNATFWGFDNEAKALRMFEITDRAGSLLTINNTSPAAWDPNNVGLDALTLQFYNGGGYLFATDGSKIWQLGFNVGFSTTDTSRQMSNTTKVEFQHSSMITPTTKWLCNNQGVFYISSGNKVYRYNPNNPSLMEPLVANMTGNVTMLKFRCYEVATMGPGMVGAVNTTYSEIVVGTDAGNIYYLDVTGLEGQAGQITKTITGITGAPVDIYDRMTQQ